MRNWKVHAYYKADGTSVGAAGIPISDAIAVVKNSVDATKLLKFNLVNQTTGITRTLTTPDKDITLAGLVDVNGGAALGSKVQSVTSTQTAGALTFGLAASVFDYRSTTLTTGATTTVTNGALSLVLPSGGTLGFVTTVQGRAVLVSLNNAGTAELAIINLAGGNSLDETGLISTTAISATSTANNVFYSTTARTSVAYRIVGFVDAVNTAGAWATPVLVQGTGGQALAALSSLGYGQIYQASSAAINVTSYNTFKKPIFFSTAVTTTGQGTATLTVVTGGVSTAILGSTPAAAGASYVCGIIPIGSSYTVTCTNGTTLVSPVELR